MIEMNDRRFNRLALGAVIAGFAMLIICFVAGFIALRSSEQSKERVDHTYQVIGELGLVEVWVERAETASRGYLLSQDRDRVETFRKNVDKIVPSVERLADLTSDNPVQRRNIVTLRTLTDAEIATLERTMGLAQASSVAAAREFFVDQVKLRRVNAIRAQTDRMRAEEQALMSQRSAAARRAFHLSELVLGIAAGLLLLLAVGAIWLVRRYTLDLARAQARLHLLNTNLEGAVAERTAELSMANDEIQRFAYIVSHDLRSPLVNVMGFTSELDTANRHIGELVDRIEAEAPDLLSEEARLAAREDLPESIGFIRTSTQKMDRLINAILKLSREGRRTLTPEQLPMNHLVETIRDSLQHRLQETGSQIMIQGRLPDIQGDRVAIEQLFSNLIENAVKYLKPGVPGRIVVRGERHGGRIVYDIEDNGRGIDPKDHQRVFDLFRRSGAQDQPGEGIGLAHVRALAYRLGGTVHLTSALGEGATFSLNLPVTYRDEGTTA